MAKKKWMKGADEKIEAAKKEEKPAGKPSVNGLRDKMYGKGKKK